MSADALGSVQLPVLPLSHTNLTNLNCGYSDFCSKK